MASSFSGSINNSSNVDITSLQPVQVTTFCVLVVLGSFKDEMEVEHFKQSIFFIPKKFNGFDHRRWKCERCSPNSLRPISYFGSIWDLYVLDLVCSKENQLHFPMKKGLTVPK